MKNRIELFLEDMTYNSRFEFFEGSEDELKAVGKKRGIHFPSHDLSVFKCVYAFVDRMNKNGCTLPREEVDKSLSTLVGKAIDFDHLRKRVVGFWLDAKIEESSIIAYGAFFKSNFADDYDTIKELMQKDTLAISFEAWGNREPNPTEGYNLTDIEFAGGALLLKESPAFPGSEVLEMAKTRVLEFAKVMTAPKNFIHGEEKTEDIPEVARMYLSDAQNIARLCAEADCPVCHEKGFLDVLSMDYEGDTAKVKCIQCGSKMEMTFTPRLDVLKKGKPRQLKEVRTVANLAMLEDVVSFINNYEESDEQLETVMSNELEESTEDGKKLTYKERKNIDDEMFAVIITTKNKINGEPRKIRMFPIHDPAHVRNALARLAQEKPQQTLQKLGVSIDNVRRKILKRAKELNMKELLDKYKKGSADELVQMFAMEIAGRELSKEELEKAFTLCELKATKAQASPTSLNNDKGPSSGNPTSLLTASISEDDVKDIVKEVAGIKAKEEAAKAEEVKKAEEAKQAEDAKKAAEEAAKKKCPTCGSLVDEKCLKNGSEDELKEKVTALEAELASFRKAKEEAEKAATEAKLKERREGLGEFAKELADADVMDDTKFELAKLKKENAELKALKKGEVKPNLTKGSNNKGEKSPEAAAREKIGKIAFPTLGNPTK